MKSNTKKCSYKLNDDGVVSFITVILLAVVMTLITTAFVRAMISNQRQTLDNQLSSQAFYAAETGVNDVTTVLKRGLIADPDVSSAMDSSDCGAFIDVIRKPEYQAFVGTNPDELNSDSNIKYTCVLVAQEVSNILLSNPAVGSGSVFPIISADGNIIDKLTIVWGNSSQDVPNGTSAQLPTQSDWGNNSVALIRLSFYYPKSFSRTDFISDQKTFFLRPVQVGGNNSLAANTASQAEPFGVTCDSSPCSLDITGINALLPGNVTPAGLYIRISPIYTSSDITITAYSGGIQQDLKGAQYSIDVTGRANDVYRRIEVRRGVIAGYNLPSSVVKTGTGSGDGGDLCKQFVVWPGGVDDIAGCSF
jgi:hypothetical protein